jgi:hypothetical protein
MKKQDKCSPSKANCTTKDLKTTKKEVANKEKPQRRNTNLVFGVKEDVNKLFNELKENKN